LGRIRLTKATTPAAAKTGTTQIEIPKNTPTIETSTTAVRGTQVQGLFYSNKTSNTFLLPISITKLKSCEGTDATMTVNSCSVQGDKLKVTVTKKKFATGIKSIKVITEDGEKTISLKLFRQEDLDIVINSLKDNYIKYRIMASPDGTTNKITHKVTLDEAKNYMKSNIKVLLYDLTANNETRTLSCEGKCILNVDGKTYTHASPIIEAHNGFLYMTLDENLYSPKKITVIAGQKDGLITFSNYNRTSYASNPWNTFRGKITFSKDQVKNLKT